MRVEENWRGGLLHNIVYLWVSLVAFGHEGNHVVVCFLLIALVLSFPAPQGLGQNHFAS